MTTFFYPYTITSAAAFEPGETGFVIEVRDFGAITQAETVEQVGERVRTLIETMIEELIDTGEAIPSGSAPGKGELVAGPGLSMAIKAALHQAVLESGVSKSELARRMQKDEKEVRRILDPHHRTGLAAAQAAFDALGVALRIAA